MSELVKIIQPDGTYIVRELDLSQVVIEEVGPEGSAIVRPKGGENA